MQISNFLHEMQLKSASNDFISNLSSVRSVHIIFLKLGCLSYIFQFKMSSLVAGKIVELLGRMTVPQPIHFTKSQL